SPDREQLHSNRPLDRGAISSAVFFAEKNRVGSILQATHHPAEAIPMDRAPTFARLRNRHQVAGRKPLLGSCADIVCNDAIARAMLAIRNHESMATRKDAAPSHSVT